jgi:glycosyltransferase involved in cell wall biosynthesis
MDWPAQCAVVIPCLNEAAAIESLVRQVREHLPSVIVVDDGSTDATGERARRAGAEVLRHDRPEGKGAALQDGLKLARERGFAWALTLDGDGQHSPGDIPAFLEHAACTGAALVIGNRMTDASRMPWLRRQVNRWMSRRLSLLAGYALPDTQCGFRLLKLEAWSQMPITTRHFEIESEMLLAFVGAGHPVEFIPIQVIYKAEQSKIHPWRDTMRWFRWLRKRRKGGAPRWMQIRPSQ